MELTIQELMAALIEKLKDKIPSWARWIAVDADGECCVYSACPFICDDVFTTRCEGRCDKIIHIVSSSPLTINWRETLTELPTINPVSIVSDHAVHNHEMVQCDQQTPPHPLYMHWKAKQDAKAFIDGMPNRELTIPSICLSEPASHMMMLGGEFGGGV